MRSDASADTLVCELGAPVFPALAWVAGVAVSLIIALTLPAPGWLRGTVAATAIVYAAASAWRWWRSMPARLVITGDGRCRGVTRDGVSLRLGRVVGAVVRRRFVSIRTEARHLLVTRAMVGPTQFRRLRTRLRTSVAP